MPFPRLGAVMAALALVAATTACSSSSTPSSQTTAAAGSTTTGGGGAGPNTTGAALPGVASMTIQGFAFHPSPATFKVGTTVTVTNDDSTNHSLTAVDGSFDTGVFSTGSKTITLSKTGTFAIHCRIHNFMTGTITVTS